MSLLNSNHGFLAPLLVLWLRDRLDVPKLRVVEDLLDRHPSIFVALQRVKHLLKQHLPKQSRHKTSSFQPRAWSQRLKTSQNMPKNRWKTTSSELRGTPDVESFGPASQARSSIYELGHRDLSVAIVQELQQAQQVVIPRPRVHLNIVSFLPQRQK